MTKNFENLDGQVLENRQFVDLDFTGELISKSEFNKCNFEKCNFSGAILKNVIFIDCKFKVCNLSNTKVNNSGWRGVEFSRCKIIGVSWRDINKLLLSWHFVDCLIEYCDFNELEMKGVVFEKCQLKNCDMNRVDLQGSKFLDTNLEGTVFQNTNLAKADLRTANYYYIDPTKNNVKNAKFSIPEVVNLLAGFGIEVDNN